MIGKTLAHYEIVEKIGAGGMGEVYRASDSKLGRDVALKILPEAFAQDAERMARFQREAQVLASLNHTNIGTIFGIEEAGSIRALVLELVDGPTLADHIRSGPLPPDRALRIARQIADALESAHEKGIVHRDLKPANVKLTEEGKVKVLDFGLAKALEPPGTASTSDPAESPTISPAISAQMTGANVILGTAAYMSPEQARGKPVDARADIWAFGVVLFEMLTGRSLFAGETVSDTLVSVLQSEPDWEQLPSSLPGSIRRLLTRCLTKDVRRRLQAIGDARIAIEEYEDDARSETSGPVPTVARGRPAGPLVAAAAAGAIIGALAWGLLGGRDHAEPRAEVARFTIAADGARIVDVGVSPEGNVLRITTQDRTLVRRLDALEARTLLEDRRATPGTFSPDGQWFSFYSQDDEIMGSGSLRKVSLDRGTVVTLREMREWTRPIAWTTNTIWLRQEDWLLRISADGGDLDTLEALNEQEEFYFQVTSKLGEKHFLAMVERRDGGSQAEVGVVVPETGEIFSLGVEGSMASYVPSGHLLFLKDRILMGASFDIDALEVDGPVTPLITDVRTYDCSTNGTLVYYPDTEGGDEQRVILVDGEGNVEPTQVNLKAWFVRAAPDGRRLITGGSENLLVHDLSTGSVMPVELHGTYPSDYVWAPDGSSIAYTGFTEESTAIYLQPIVGSAPPTVLLEAEPDEEIFPTDWSPDGTNLIVSRYFQEDSDLWVLPLDGSAPRPLLATKSSEDLARFSPDGMWVAYESTESGRQEVYVSSIRLEEARLGPKWKASGEGGKDPIWSPDGGELYFEDFQDRMVAVSVRTSPEDPTSLAIGDGRVLFDLRSLGNGVLIGPDLSYDVSPTDGRFVFLEHSAREEADVHVVLNWFTELEALMSPVAP